MYFELKYPTQRKTITDINIISDIFFLETQYRVSAALSQVTNPTVATLKWLDNKPTIYQRGRRSISTSSSAKKPVPKFDSTNSTA